MSDRPKGITRRSLLGGVAAGAAAVALGPRLAFGGPPAQVATKARLVRVESDRIWRGDERDPRVVAAMVDRGLMALTGATTVTAAWGRFVKPELRVGLKINVLGRPLIYTAPEITDAMIVGLIAAGVKPANLVVWDRWPPHFLPTRYQLGTGKHGERIEHGASYHKTIALKGSKGSAALATMLTDATDVTINLPVLKDHRMAGVTLALKNIAFGCYDHYKDAHEGHCEPFIAEAYQHCVAHAKIPLHVMDATSACFDDGPRPSGADRLWRENAIYFATDPVALDVAGRAVLMAKRKAKGLPDKTRDARHIEAASQKGLGVGDPARIEVVTIKV
ncbi:MAG TPA: DUF362 domain-containing protein [Polyangia bacterium]|jgi:hypothetical protein